MEGKNVKESKSHRFIEGKNVGSGKIRSRAMPHGCNEHSTHLLPTRTLVQLNRPPTAPSCASAQGSTSRIIWPWNLLHIIALLSYKYYQLALSTWALMGLS